MGAWRTSSVRRPSCQTLTRSVSYPIKSNAPSSTSNSRMPKLRKPPPPAILDHLLQRFREGPIGIEDFTDLKHWLARASSPKHFSHPEWRRKARKFNEVLG
jgi:hypothetical protein